MGGWMQQGAARRWTTTNFSHHLASKAPTPTLNTPNIPQHPHHHDPYTPCAAAVAAAGGGSGLKIDSGQLLPKLIQPHPRPCCRYNLHRLWRKVIPKVGCKVCKEVSGVSGMGGIGLGVERGGGGAAAVAGGCTSSSEPSGCTSSPAPTVPLQRRLPAHLQGTALPLLGAGAGPARAVPPRRCGFPPPAGGSGNTGLMKGRWMGQPFRFREDGEISAT